MRKLLLGLIGFWFVISSFGQELTVNVEVDTLKIIQTIEIPTKEICFGIPDGKVFINKASLIGTWENELALWKDELDRAAEKKDWQIENYKKSKLYLEFVKRHDSLFFEAVSDGSVTQTLQIEEQLPEADTLSDMKNYIKKIVCNLLDIGEFEVQIDNKRIESVLKARVRRLTDNYETISTEYIASDTIHFWICPPIIHSDFVVEPEVGDR